ncbi:MAG: DUF503 domain-containing protein [Armatimonadetes bacterium]|nr:DUF503 domain-containing protein [Armatimonadota bacterium]
MIVKSLEMHIRLPGCRSLKEKRHVIKPLIERAKRSFGVTICEVGDLDIWNASTVGAAAVSNDALHAHQVLESVLESFDECPEIEILHHAIEQA